MPNELPSTFDEDKVQLLELQGNNFKQFKNQIHHEASINNTRTIIYSIYKPYLDFDKKCALLKFIVKKI